MNNYCADINLLKHKTILVTGAGDGIGRTASLCFAKHGATVILLGRTQAKLEAVYDEIAANGSPEAVIQPLDLQLASEANYKALMEAIAEQFQTLDGLLNNAAVLGPLNPLEFYPADQWAQVMQINVNAAFMLTKALLPLITPVKDGRILFTSSSVGVKGRAYWGAYAVSRFAIQGLMEVLADELKATSSVRVNCINPGATRTKMRKLAYPAENPLSLATPDDLMPTYLYLMGRDSGDVHGQTINVQDPG